MVLKRCARCILPENYPGITFDEEGICNYCGRHKERKYRGGDALREGIKSVLEGQKDVNDDYDCVLAFSGGRDSSFLLYYLVKVLNLRVLAFCVDNGFIPEQTKLNMKNMVDSLGVRFEMREYGYQKKCIKHHISAWMHRPSAAMVGMLCTGCRLAMEVKIPEFARENDIPVIITGATPFEGESFKTKILTNNPKTSENQSLVRGYLTQVLENPRWITNLNCLITQVREFYYHYHRTKAGRKGTTLVAPFSSYIRWEEETVVSTIEDEFSWGKNPNTASTWRGDCDIALLKLHLYKKTLGFNDKDEGLSHLIRDGQVTRVEALQRIEREGEISEGVIKEVFSRLGLRFSDLKAALSRA